MMKARLILLVVVLSGCAQAPSRTDDGAPPLPFPSSNPTPFPTGGTDAAHPAFRDLANGSYSAIGELTRTTITDDATWATFWSNLTSNEAPRPALPKVDFSKETVAAVTMGEKPSGCFAIQITGLFAIGGIVNANVTNYAPRSGQGCTSALTHPYDIIAIDGAGLTVAYNDQAAEGSPTNAPSGAARPLAIRVLDTSTESGYTNETRLVVADDATWRATWQQHRGGSAPLPDVDFSKETVVLAALGERDSTCWRIEVTNATLVSEGSAQADVTSRALFGGSGCSAGTSHVAEVVAIEGARLDMTFIEKHVLG